jgi:hypothetical protein
MTTTMAWRRAKRFRTSSASPKLVPRLAGWKQRISRITRRTWRRPFLGGMYFSTSSVNRIKPHFVVVADGGEGQHGGEFGGQFAFGLVARAEEARTAQVHHQHERQFALLDKLLDKRMVHPRRHVPVNRTDFIARLVFAHLLEIHALTLENAVVLAAQSFRNQPRGAQLDLADFFENFAGIILGEMKKIQS